VSGNGQDIAASIQRTLRVLVAATIFLYVIVILAGTWGWYVNKQESDQNTSALCALRQDLERRANASEDFLARNPHGLLGISPGDLQKSIADTQRSIVALSSLHCPPPAS
jgi:type II secretory pathway pseudopilin PulG